MKVQTNYVHAKSSFYEKKNYGKLLKKRMNKQHKYV